MKVQPALKQQNYQHQQHGKGGVGTTSPNYFAFQSKINSLIYRQNQTPSNPSKGSLQSTEMLPGTFSTEQRQQDFVNNLSNSKPFKRLMDEHRGSITDKKLNLPQKHISDFKQTFFNSKKHSLTQEQNCQRDFHEAVISNESFGKQNKKVDTAIGSNQDDIVSKKVLFSNVNNESTVVKSVVKKENSEVVNQILIKQFLTSPKKAFYNMKDLYENYSKSCKLQEKVKLNQTQQPQKSNMRDFSFQVTDNPEQEEAKLNETADNSHDSTRLQLYDNTQREIYSAFPQKHRSANNRKYYASNNMSQRNSASLVFSIHTASTKNQNRRHIDKVIASENSRRDVHPSADARSYRASPQSSRAFDYVSTQNHVDVHFNMIDSSKAQKFKKIIIESSDLKDTSIMTDFNYNIAGGGYYESSSRAKKGHTKPNS
ncbi:UNKNOWN [Stylonychia lemnae]|uniref:Uncharacterized protein n=1 Tax=Stylonychia lemnae TaxID=5949 RepID=A0A078A775_STYLE|nr:UNKNOWN [Stylonychia lemnae]|eukprot:CDW77736.1 UNKNOWN [Stylonychia lemnae]